MIQHLLSTGPKRLAEASPFDPAWGIGLPADDPEARTPSGGQGKSCSETLFFLSATPFAQARPGWQTPPSLINYALRPRSTELMTFPVRRLALWLWPALA